MMLKKRKKENLITSQMFLDELANGSDNIKRRTVPTNTRNR